MCDEHQDRLANRVAALRVDVDDLKVRLSWVKADLARQRDAFIRLIEWMQQHGKMGEEGAKFVRSGLVEHPEKG